MSSNRKDPWWAKMVFQEYASHYFGMTIEEMGKDTFQSVKDVLEKNPNGESFGSKMVRLAMERIEHNREIGTSNGLKGGRPKKSGESTEKTPEQLIYGKWANVYLTQDQFNELLKDCGNLNDLNSMIDQLSCKLEDGSIESENHAATLSYWIEYRKGKVAQVAEVPRYKTLDERNRENYEAAIARIEAKYGK